eukprot:SAG31_NODE_5334_length_2602_cov_17.228925_3_plen_198_part_00
MSHEKRSDSLGLAPAATAAPRLLAPARSDDERRPMPALRPSRTRQAALAAKVAGTQAELAAIVAQGGAGAAPASELAAVLSADALTLVCAAGGATVRVPLSLAKAESELLSTMLEDVNDASLFAVPELDEAQVLGFAAFVRQAVAAAPGPLAQHSMLGGDFVALFSAADYHIVVKFIYNRSCAIDGAHRASEQTSVH